MKMIWQSLKKWWMAFATALGWVNTRILLTLVYVLLIGPGAIVLKLLRKDRLERKHRHTASYWKAKEAGDHSLERARHQF